MRPASSQTADEQLAELIQQGQALIGRAGLVGDVSDYESWKAARRQWVEQTAETLGHLYDGSHEVDEFRGAASIPQGKGPWLEEYAADLDSLRAASEVLVSLKEEPDFDDRPLDGSALAGEHTSYAALAHEDAASEPEHELSVPDPPLDREPERAPPPIPDLDPPALLSDPPPARASPSEDAPSRGPVRPELASAPPPRVEPAGRRPAVHDVLEHDVTDESVSPVHLATAAVSQPEHTGRVFLVHGRNDRWKHAVVSLLERAGSHEVTIVNERTSARGMLMEEFVQQTTGEGYALILLTADDIGAPRVESDREPFFTTRACQGVIFEMGFLAATLTPQCVCVLYEEGVELPCDLAGMSYVRLDAAGTWQSKLLLQLRAAGFAYDVNLLAPAGEHAQVSG